MECGEDFFKTLTNFDHSLWWPSFLVNGVLDFNYGCGDFYFFLVSYNLPNPYFKIKIYKNIMLMYGLFVWNPFPYFHITIITNFNMGRLIFLWGGFFFKSGLLSFSYSCLWFVCLAHSKVSFLIGHVSFALPL